ncbi:MAG: four helix bundle protein [Opitutaceae bacterium]|jgi:four helix bundle protein|nr:four helix bundle protein [Opitutaceae bacterium]
MQNNDLKQRPQQFALRVIRMTDSLPKNMAAEIVGRQLLRADTSVASNHRAACRGRSKAEFTAKLGIAEKASDETSFWLESVEEAEMLPAQKFAALRKKSDKITAITANHRRPHSHHAPPRLDFQFLLPPRRHPAHLRLAFAQIPVF